MNKTVKIITVLLTCLWFAPVFAQDLSSQTMETLREAAKSNKKALVALNLNLTETEDKAFWPIYESYQKDIAKVNERLANLIKDYAKETKHVPLPTKRQKRL